MQCNRRAFDLVLAGAGVPPNLAFGVVRSLVLGLQLRPVDLTAWRYTSAIPRLIRLKGADSPSTKTDTGPEKKPSFFRVQLRVLCRGKQRDNGEHVHEGIRNPFMAH
ncbi:hypothetical protein MPTK1_8g08260 [Marchantia polymorpha subsp. ruderalis]|uniref:Uncharacterized protein n=1 Tax=Marchantia polymorpha TaxID=3197 RepID=A0A2R6WRR7_MARPO|nr:hypothetical protein MARPO_0063s0092 [Marchantia polymorpha]BBN19152.1 hypothetical protein Mp_8g08260 [Marchantia polymorpha subsp. ruderalis]|eukprot:PTQ36560.1 hypothetical protein MARPO_0063s0092 [Marchantia polymorpha]